MTPQEKKQAARETVLDILDCCAGVTSFAGALVVIKDKLLEYYPSYSSNNGDSVSRFLFSMEKDRLLHCKYDTAGRVIEVWR